MSKLTQNGGGYSVARPLWCRVMLVSAVLASCSWAGFQRAPPEDSLVAVGAGSVHLYQPSPRRQQFLREAFAEVLRIFATPSFQQAVQDRTQWLTRANRCSARGEAWSVTGAEVVETVLRPVPTGVHYLANNVCNAIAETAMCPSRTVIDSDRVDLWGSDSRADRAELVGTIAHELTHLVPRELGAAGNCATRYVDDGHTRCTERYLVSYQIGEAARCFYQYEGDSSAFHTCLTAAGPNEECRSEFETIGTSCARAAAR